MIFTERRLFSLSLFYRCPYFTEAKLLLEDDDGNDVYVQVLEVYQGSKYHTFTNSCTLLVEVISTPPSYSQISQGRQYVIKIEDPRWASRLRSDYLKSEEWNESAFIADLHRAWSDPSLASKVQFLVRMLFSGEMVYADEHMDQLLNHKNVFLQELGLLFPCHVLHNREKRNLRALQEAKVDFVPRPFGSFRTKAWLSALPPGLDQRLFQYPVTMMEYIQGKKLSSITKEDVLSDTDVGYCLSLMEDKDLDCQDSALVQLSVAMMFIFHRCFDLRVELDDIRGDNFLVQREPDTGRLSVHLIDLAGVYIYTPEEEQQGHDYANIECDVLGLVAESLTGDWTLRPQQEKLVTGRLDFLQGGESTNQWRLLIEDVFQSSSAETAPHVLLCTILVACAARKLMCLVIESPGGALSATWSLSAVKPLCMLFGDPTPHHVNKRLCSIIERGRSQIGWTDLNDISLPRKLLRGGQIFQHDAWHHEAAELSPQGFADYINARLFEAIACLNKDVFSTQKDSQDTVSTVSSRRCNQPRDYVIISSPAVVYDTSFKHTNTNLSASTSSSL